MKDDLRSAIRRLLRNPRVALIAVGTLALGIGAATAVFTVAHTILMAPPPFRDAGSLVTIRNWRQDYRGVSAADMLDYSASGAFNAIALESYGAWSWTGQSMAGFDGADVLRGLSVTPDYFRVLDHPMAAGRSFVAGERGVVVISHALWQSKFAASSAVIGQSLTLNGQPHTIVGVAGAGFLPYQSYEVRVWVPFQPTYQNRGSRNNECHARLASGITLDQARERLAALSTRLQTAYPDTNSGLTTRVDPLLHELRQQSRPAVLALLAAVTCLLLIAAANVAGLLLARGAAQAREMAVRSALGASRLRLCRLLLTESLLLALTASAFGCLIATWLLAALRALIPPSLQYGWMFTADWRVFVAGLALAALAGIVAGTAPALESFRAALGGLRLTVSRGRLLRAIVVAEIALAVLLCVGAGLLARSFGQLAQRRLGYETGQLLGMRVRLSGDRYERLSQRSVYWSQLLERAASIAGVASAATVSDLPMGQQYGGSTFAIPGYQARRDEDQPYAHKLAASPNYFATIGIPLPEGRPFTDADTAASEPVVIVNDILVRKYFGTAAGGLGQTILPDGRTPARIIGIIGAIRHNGPEDEPEPQLYRPVAQNNVATMFLLLRTTVPPESVTTAVREQLRQLDPQVPAFEIRTLQSALDRQLSMPRLPALITTTLATVAAVLAALGLFGVVAYWVAQRTREIGIRTALGARTPDIRRLVLGEGLRMGLTGLAIGLLMASAAGRALRSLLYGMSDRDPRVYAATVALIAAATALACWVPAERAARVAPSEALRHDG